MRFIQSQKKSQCLHFRINKEWVFANLLFILGNGIYYPFFFQQLLPLNIERIYQKKQISESSFDSILFVYKTTPYFQDLTNITKNNFSSTEFKLWKKLRNGLQNTDSLTFYMSLNNPKLDTLSYNYYSILGDIVFNKKTNYENIWRVYNTNVAIKDDGLFLNIHYYFLNTIELKADVTNKNYLKSLLSLYQIHQKQNRSMIVVYLNFMWYLQSHGYEDLYVLLNRFLINESENFSDEQKVYLNSVFLRIMEYNFKKGSIDKNLNLSKKLKHMYPDEIQKVRLYMDLPLDTTLTIEPLYQRDISYLNSIRTLDNLLKENKLLEAKTLLKKLENNGDYISDLKYQKLSVYSYLGNFITADSIYENIKKHYNHVNNISIIQNLNSFFIEPHISDYIINKSKRDPVFSLNEYLYYSNLKAQYSDYLKKYHLDFYIRSKNQYIDLFSNFSFSSFISFVMLLEKEENYRATFKPIFPTYDTIKQRLHPNQRVLIFIKGLKDSICFNISTKGVGVNRVQNLLYEKDKDYIILDPQNINNHLYPINYFKKYETLPNIRYINRLCGEVLTDENLNETTLSFFGTDQSFSDNGKTYTKLYYMDKEFKPELQNINFENHKNSDINFFNTITHISGHFIIDSLHPLYNKVPLKIKHDSIDYLYGYQIYQKSIGSKLVFMNNCYSNHTDFKSSISGRNDFGKFFIDNNVSTVILTNKKIDDRIAATFSSQFYYNFLVEKKSSTESVRLAKLYIKNTYDLSPMEWNAFFILGKNIRIKSLNDKYTIFFSSILIVILYAVFIKKRSQK